MTLIKNIFSHEFNTFQLISTKFNIILTLTDFKKYKPIFYNFKDYIKKYLAFEPTVQSSIVWQFWKPQNVRFNIGMVFWPAIQDRRSCGYSYQAPYQLNWYSSSHLSHAFSKISSIGHVRSIFDLPRWPFAWHALNYLCPKTFSKSSIKTFL